MIAYTDLDAAFIIRRFPEYKESVEEAMRGYDAFYPHIVFGNVFGQRTAFLLKQEDYAENEILRRIFDFFEELSADGDNETQNLVQVTLLEHLWDEKTTYHRASELLGVHTGALWDDIGHYLRVP